MPAKYLVLVALFYLKYEIYGYMAGQRVFPRCTEPKVHHRGEQKPIVGLCPVLLQLCRKSDLVSDIL